MAGSYNKQGAWVEDTGVTATPQQIKDSQTYNTSDGWGAILGPAASVAGSIYSGNQVRNAANSAYSQQQQGANTANNLLQPTSGLVGSSIQKLTGNPSMSDMPGYQFGLDQSEKAINRALAARGSFNSGAALSALTKNAQDYADTNYGNYFNRQKSLLDSGMGAINSQAGIATGLSNAGAANQIAQGATRANQALGIGSTLANYLGSTPRGSSTSNGSSLASLIGSGLTSAGNTLSDCYNQATGNSNEYLQNAMSGGSQQDYAPSGDVSAYSGVGGVSSTWNPYTNEYE
jgi:hypothetical protein